MTRTARLLFTTFALWAGLAGTAPAQDSGSWYARLYGGLSRPAGTDIGLMSGTTPLSFKQGGLAGGAIGYDYAGPWRAEVAFTYRSADLRPVPFQGELASTILMVNGLYSFGTVGPLQPYVGLGVGTVTEIDLDLTGGGASGEYSDRSLLAGQILLGADYAVTDRWSLFTEARYLATAKPKLRRDSGTGADLRYRTLDLVVGVTLKF